MRFRSVLLLLAQSHLYGVLNLGVDWLLLNIDLELEFLLNLLQFLDLLLELISFSHHIFVTSLFLSLPLGTHQLVADLLRVLDLLMQELEIVHLLFLNQVLPRLTLIKVFLDRLIIFIGFINLLLHPLDGIDDGEVLILNNPLDRLYLLKLLVYFLDQIL